MEGGSCSRTPAAESSDSRCEHVYNLSIPLPAAIEPLSLIKSDRRVSSSSGSSFDAMVADFINYLEVQSNSKSALLLPRMPLLPSLNDDERKPVVWSLTSSTTNRDNGDGEDDQLQTQHRAFGEKADQRSKRGHGSIST